MLIDSKRAVTNRHVAVTCDVISGIYALLYGPTAGDRIRLADTSLLIEVEQDLCA